MLLRLVTYRSASAQSWEAGVEIDGNVVAARALGPYPSTVKELLSLAPALFDEMLDAAIVAARSAGAVDVAGVELGPAIPDPGKIICLGLNYKDHAAEANLPIPSAPVLFAKYQNSLTGPYDDIVVPAVANAKVDYEAELVVVIGRRASGLSEGDALDYVAGYAAFNDVSARDLQMQTSQWGAGKAIDTFGPLGPGIVPARFIPDPQALMMSARVNGERLQHASTSQMIFTIAQTLAYITQFMTLEPGDIIATGTPAGVGFIRKPPVLLKDGDVVEIEIERVGTLRNAVRFEAPRTASDPAASRTLASA
jgi:acylpyruvate hydrolase